MNELPFTIPTVQDSKILFEHFLRVRSDTLKLADESLYEYYSVQTRPGAVMALVSTSDDKWVINLEYRHPTQKVLLCCPGGLVDAGEDPLTAAKRELLEESGYVAEDWKEMGSAYPFPGLADQRIHYFRAYNAQKQQDPAPETAELFHTIVLSQDELNERIRNGESVDGILLSALYFSMIS